MPGPPAGFGRLIADETEEVGQGGARGRPQAGIRVGYVLHMDQRSIVTQSFGERVTFD